MFLNCNCLFYLMIWAHFLFFSTSFISNPLACLSCPLPEMIWATRFSFRSFAWTLGIERQSLRIALFKIHSDPINTDVIGTGKALTDVLYPFPFRLRCHFFAIIDPYVLWQSHPRMLTQIKSQERLPCFRWCKTLRWVSHSSRGGGTWNIRSMAFLCMKDMW